MYETLLDVITVGVVVAGVVACAARKRAMARQVDAMARQVDSLRAEVAIARIEGVLGQEPHAGEIPAIPAPARGKN